MLMLQYVADLKRLKYSDDSINRHTGRSNTSFADIGILEVKCIYDIIKRAGGIYY